MAWPNKVHREYPSTVNARMESTIKPFIQNSNDVNMTLMEVFNEKLGLPKGTLVEKHKLYEPSGSESRCIKNPPRSGASAADTSKTAIGAHTDFGSLVREATADCEKSTKFLVYVSHSCITVSVVYKSCLPVLTPGTTSA